VQTRWNKMNVSCSVFVQESIFVSLLLQPIVLFTQQFVYFTLATTKNGYCYSIVICGKLPCIPRPHTLLAAFILFHCRFAVGLSICHTWAPYRWVVCSKVLYGWLYFDLLINLSASLVLQCSHIWLFTNCFSGSGEQLVTCVFVCLDSNK